jgi:hypothetical protein
LDDDSEEESENDDENDKYEKDFVDNEAEDSKDK